MKKFTLNSAAAIFAGAVFAFSSTSAVAEGTPAKKTVIHSQSELPTYSYKLTTTTASELLDDHTAQLALAGAVRKDAETTLAKYEITDKATLRDLYAAVRDAALLQGDVEAVFASDAKIRGLLIRPINSIKRHTSREDPENRL